MRQRLFKVIIREKKSAGREKQTLTSWSRNLVAKPWEGGGRRVTVREEHTGRVSSVHVCLQCKVWGGAGDAPKGLRQGLSAAGPFLPNTEP